MMQNALLRTRPAERWELRENQLSAYLESVCGKLVRVDSRTHFPTSEDFVKARPIFASLILALCMAHVHAAPIATHSGDGLTVIVNDYDPTTGVIRGTMRIQNIEVPFTGTRTRDGNDETIRGSYTVNGREYPFSSQGQVDADETTVTIDNKTYRIREVDPNVAPPRPIDRPVVPPAVDNRPPANQQAAADSLRLRRFDFLDTTMGVTAYSVLLPVGWQAEGVVEWPPEAVSFPQKKFKITSPTGGKVETAPALNFLYSEMNPLDPVPGVPPMPVIPPQGTPPPTDFLRWIAETAAKVNPNLNDLRLINAVRNRPAEQMADDIDRQTGGANPGTARECWIITMEYDEAGTRRREEMDAQYYRQAPYNTPNMNSQMWTVYINSMISAPVESFAEQRPALFNAINSVQQSPAWWYQSQQLIAAMSRQRLADSARAIRERGEQIKRMSPADKQQVEASYLSDRAQRSRTNAVKETQDYRDTDGTLLNLPIHYAHTFSDGRGNIVMSNRSSDKPGESWEELPPMK